MRVGETTRAHYVATNLLGRAASGRATFNVTPDLAGAYFNKVECFCFTDTTLEPGEALDMPVVFYVDPDIVDVPELKNVNTITLSYTFFPTDQDAPLAAAPGPDAKRAKQPRVGLERSTPFPAGSPEAGTPDLSIGRPVQLQGGDFRLPSTLEHGTLIGEDGEEIPIEDVIIEGGIRPLEPGEENPVPTIPPPKAKTKRGKNKTKTP